MDQVLIREQILIAAQVPSPGASKEAELARARKVLVKWIRLWKKKKHLQSLAHSIGAKLARKELLSLESVYIQVPCH